MNTHRVGCEAESPRLVSMRPESEFRFFHIPAFGGYRDRRPARAGSLEAIPRSHPLRITNADAV